MGHVPRKDELNALERLAEALRPSARYLLGIGLGIWAVLVAFVVVVVGLGVTLSDRVIGIAVLAGALGIWLLGFHQVYLMYASRVEAGERRPGRVRSAPLALGILVTAVMLCWFVGLTIMTLFSLVTVFRR